MAASETFPERDAATGTPRPRSYGEIAGFFDDFADREDRWLSRRGSGGYRSLVTNIATALVPAGLRVLEIGAGRGDLLAALRPSRGVGVDISPRMVEIARRRHPGLEFLCMAGEDLELEERFDYIVLSDIVGYVEDLQGLFEAVARHCHRRTRIVLSTYSNAWRPLLQLLALLGVRPRRPIRNWVGAEDLVNLAELAGLERVTERKEILLPIEDGALSRLANGFLSRLPVLRSLTLTHWLVARPASERIGEMTVSVVVPCHNEAGTIEEAVDRMPEMGAGTEIVFVDDHSSDGTPARVDEVRASRPDRNIKLVLAKGRGKSVAVREGFEAASGEILMILDGDLTVAPEDLPKFYEGIASGRGDLINGSRLVYEMEPGAMRFLNLLGNKFFALFLSSILGQFVKDTLCGTKALHRADWELIRERRHEFSEADPYGDFDLLLGAALLGLRIRDVPVRYRARYYGESKMRRFPVGGTFFRLAVAGFRRLWVRPVDP
jgi:SAM-dependent methyltransferase